MVLVDTSVWIDHLRSGNASLAALLNDGKALIHPFIIGELACGHLKNRREILLLLHALPHVDQAQDSEVLFFIERHKLMGRGLGWIDCHLLASSRLGNVPVLTHDKTLIREASRLKLAAN